ncbi:hypothetical protein NX794_03670 [Streptomyces sp. LP11]|uniref:Lipoprotein n=1 Tax=Streptomyces pyxinicus TaxID=2970331 RepID=A0ABT2AVQ4_9ACTN|nr:hypothetical protein [Streptomyces sp. LP11]MCS0600332.1 hypothetical protein [Streptomyces sp. LP11]
MNTRRTAIRTAVPAALLVLALAACSGEAPGQSAIPDKFPSSGNSAAMTRGAEQLRVYGEDHDKARITDTVDRVLGREDGHVLISTRIGTDDDATTTAQQVAGVYRAYAADTSESTSVTVYNVLNDALVTRQLHKEK